MYFCTFFTIFSFFRYVTVHKLRSVVYCNRAKTLLKSYVPNFFKSCPMAFLLFRQHMLFLANKQPKKVRLIFCLLYFPHLSSRYIEDLFLFSIFAISAGGIFAYILLSFRPPFQYIVSVFAFWNLYIYFTTKHKIVCSKSKLHCEIYFGNLLCYGCCKKCIIKLLKTFLLYAIITL